jgi:hypothetical protein
MVYLSLLAIVCGSSGVSTRAGKARIGNFRSPTVRFNTPSKLPPFNKAFPRTSASDAHHNNANGRVLNLRAVAAQAFGAPASTRRRLQSCRVDNNLRHLRLSPRALR